jgi:CDP-4-dehydro-6-deoxyglucose reductase
MTFSVLVKPSDRRFTVESGESLLDAALRQGVPLPHGCRDGTCGACKCPRLGGTLRHGAHHANALSPAEESRGFVLPCRATALSDVVLQCPQVGTEDALPVRRMPARVTALERMSHDVMIVRLAVPASACLAYRAGQYVDVILRDGTRRSYSLASHSTRDATTDIELHLRHMPGGRFTDHVFDGLKEKDVLRLEGPYGSFCLRDGPGPIVLLASGTGFAPIKALIEQMRERGIVRRATLYWGGRRPADLYMNDWVLRACADMPHLSYVPVVSDALPGDRWTGRTGFVHRAVLADLSDLSGYQVYACGAPVVVEAARRDFAAAGLPPGGFVADAFITAADRR